jgi:hypothetical protein
MRTKNRVLGFWLLLSLGGGSLACGGEAIRVGESTGAAGRGGTARPSGPSTAVEAPVEEAAPEVDPSLVPLSFRDEDFVEGDTNRDPFRNYAAMFMPSTAEIARPQRDVIMPDVPLEEMRLIAIVSGVASPSAMIEDNTGTGFTVHRGDFLGREDVVNAGGTEGLPITLNWRVDRIHAGEVILTREDPTAPNRVPLTRVMPLHDEVEGG